MLKYYKYKNLIKILNMKNVSSLFHTLDQLQELLVEHFWMLDVKLLIIHLQDLI